MSIIRIFQHRGIKTKWRGKYGFKSKLVLPQAINIARATSFIKTNIAVFFDNYKGVWSKYTLDAKDMWNVNETGIMTVYKPDRVIARRGKKQMP